MSSGVTSTIELVKAGTAVQQALNEECLAISQELAGRMQKFIRDEGLVAFGTLVGSVTGKVTPTGTGVAVEVGTPVPQGEYTEFGSRPHYLGREGMEALKLWVEEKLKPQQIVKVTLKEGKIQRRTRTLTGDARERAVWQATWAVASAIARRGVRGRLWMKQAIESMGLRAEVTETPEGKSYEVDIAAFLQPRMGEIVESALKRYGDAQ